MYDFIKDPTFFNFVRGPMVWLAFAVFFGGSIYRIYTIISMAKKEAVVFPYIKLKYIFRSLLHWLIPFGTTNWRRRWVVTLITFPFHICIIVTPIFLLAHNVLWYESWGINLWSLPDRLADIMTLIVIGGCGFFLIRRILSPEVRYVSYLSDFIILTITVLPFLTGYLAAKQMLLPHNVMTILHILSGEVMLMAVPFTRIGHMLSFWLTRAYSGSEFGLVRHTYDW
jgi:nitrate reductase gamma subunit